MATPTYTYKVTDSIGQTIEIGDNVLVLPKTRRTPYYSIFLGESECQINKWLTTRDVFLLFQNYSNTLKPHPFYKEVISNIYLKTQSEIMLKANEHVIPWDTCIGDNLKKLNKLLTSKKPKPLDEQKQILLKEYLTLPQGEWLKQRIT